MTVGMLAFWGLVIWAVATLLRTTDRQERGPRPTAEEILARRFAAGEIDSEDYHQRLNALRSATVPHQ